jgi:hypothetical protein
MEAEALAGHQADGPDPHAFAFRHQRVADAAVRVLRFVFEFLLQGAGPFGALLARRRLVHHGQCHCVSSLFVSDTIMAAGAGEKTGHQ